MLPAVAFALLLAGSDRPEQVSLTPRDEAPPAAFAAEEHPVATALIVSGAVATAIAVVVLVILTAPRRSTDRYGHCEQNVCEN